jgi:AraC family transcriptional regulator
MRPLNIALWFVERRLAEEFTLADVARAAGLSPRHLARLFALSTGRPLMGYVRARRLSEAAKTLAASDISILSVALGFGYNSNEAFTRAFADEFGAPPSMVRTIGALSNLNLTEPLTMSSFSETTLAPARIEKSNAKIFAGLNARYACGAFGGIPDQWARFSAFRGAVPNVLEEGVAYGVSHNFSEDGDIDYLSGVEVSRADVLPPEFAVVRAPAGEYAVFEHRGHVSGIAATWTAIFAQGIPALGRDLAPSPSFERMDHRYDRRKGEGVIEIWLPLV